jgi:hypothetical protein
MPLPSRDFAVTISSSSACQTWRLFFNGTMNTDLTVYVAQKHLPLVFEVCTYPTISGLSSHKVLGGSSDKELHREMVWCLKGISKKVD